MLHVGVLPHHDRWGDVLANLRFVVVDEAHVYRGVFGSHVANVLRRLRRLARAYGSEPQFVLASATIANPAGLAESLLGVPATVVDADAAPRSERTVALWNPELIDPELGVRASALGDASRLLAEFVARGPAHDLLREEPQGGRADPPLHLRASRRRDREAPRPVSRRLHADAAARDRAPADGRRAARRLGDRRARARDRHRLARLRHLGRLPRNRLLAAAAVGPRRPARPRPRRAVASEDALDQFFMREPETLLGAAVEAAILDHANPRVLDGHVLAAAFEGPIDERDARDARPGGARARRGAARS